MCAGKLRCQNKNLMLERLGFKNPTLIFFLLVQLAIYVVV